MVSSSFEASERKIRTCYEYKRQSKEARTLTGLFKNFYLLIDVAQVERVVITRHDILSKLGDFEHLAELVHVAGHEIQE
jgi:predicted site-specific integrase-resolvase